MCGWGRRGEGADLRLLKVNEFKTNDIRYFVAAPNDTGERWCSRSAGWWWGRSVFQWANILLMIMKRDSVGCCQWTSTVNSFNIFSVTWVHTQLTFSCGTSWNGNPLRNTEFHLESVCIVFNTEKCWQWGWNCVYKKWIPGRQYCLTCNWKYFHSLIKLF